MRVVVFPLNHIDDDGIEELVSAIQQADPHLQVKKGLEIKRKDIALIEVIGIYLVGKVVDVIVKKIIEAGIDWGKERIETNKTNSNPLVISIFGVDGVPIISKRISPSGEVRDNTANERNRPLPIELL